MALNVEIDSYSGFCGGVIRAIGNAEDFLKRNPDNILYSLGDIVHNEAELERLHVQGLVTIDAEDLDDIQNASGKTLLIRAHGEPPLTYEVAKAKGFKIIDCTCPVVLKIQKSIKETYARLHVSAEPGQIVIFGKIGHAEVLGLVGQVNGDAKVVENIAQLENLLKEGIVRTNRDIEIFSQTTMSPVEYQQVCEFLASRMEEGCSLNVHETICSQVASRHSQLTDFANDHDVIVFVSGKSSSNGKVLSALCKSVNIRTYHISEMQEITSSWFRSDDKVGICGATSTPLWLLEKVAAYIENLQQ